MSEYITAENKARIIDYSSYSQGCVPANLLNSNDRQLWISDMGFPQFITIDISRLDFRPPTFSAFGWRCWHTYSSNPALVELHVSSNNISFTKWAVLKAQKVRGNQFFSIQPLPNSTRSIRITVLDSFGASKCYFNQVFLVEAYKQPRPMTMSQSSAHLRVDDRARLQTQLKDMQNTINSLKSAPVLKTVAKERELSNMKHQIADLTQNISKLEGSQVDSSQMQSLMTFKASLLKETKKSEERGFDFAHEWEEYMKQWQAQVLSPLLEQMSEKVLGRLNEKPSVGQLLTQLQGKLTEKVEKVKKLEAERTRRTNLLKRNLKK